MEGISHKCMLSPPAKGNPEISEITPKESWAGALTSDYGVSSPNVQHRVLGTRSLVSRHWDSAFKTQCFGHCSKHLIYAGLINTQNDAKGYYFIRLIHSTDGKTEAQGSESIPQSHMVNIS